MFVLLGLGFKPEHFSCVMSSLFTKVLMLFVCLHMFIELLVGYICEILGLLATLVLVFIGIDIMVC
jgi:hypothetical protein